MKNDVKKWSSSKSDAKKSSNGPIRRLKLEAGVTTRIRIVEDNFEHAWIHWYKGIFINKEGEKVVSLRRSVCLGRSVCPVCQLAKIKNNQDYNARHRYFFNVIDRSEQEATGKTEIKLMDIGPSVYDQIASSVEDEEYGNPSGYDFKITRTGNGKRDTKYKARPSIKKIPLSKNELRVIGKPTDEGGCYKLLDFTSKKDIDEVTKTIRKKDRLLLKEYHSMKDDKKLDD